MRPRVKVRAGEAVCPSCGKPALPEFASTVEDSSPLAEEPLSRVGIPPYDIVRVDGPAELRVLPSGRRPGCGESDRAWGLSR